MQFNDKIPKCKVLIQVELEISQMWIESHLLLQEWLYKAKLLCLMILEE